MSRLFVLISGFGPPHWEHKLAILKNNLTKITSFPWEKIKITICQYADPEEYKIPEELLQEYPVSVVYEKGIVGEFIKRHASPEAIRGFDYVLLLLDDIELIHMDFAKAIQYQQELLLDIVSPSLTTDSKIQYTYMLQEHRPFDVKITNVCEYFCMLFPASSYPSYYRHIDLENPWMWALDLILHKHLGLRVGILNHYCMKHWYKTESYGMCPDIDPLLCFHRYIKRYGETAEGLAGQKAVRGYWVEIG